MILLGKQTINDMNTYKKQDGRSPSKSSFSRDNSSRNRKPFSKDKPSFQGKSSFQGKPSFQGKSNFGNRSSSKRGSPKSVDHNLFVNKAKEIETKDEYTAKNTFETFGLNEKLLQNIKNKGYEHPSPIQDQAIPHILENKDMVGLANTGTGKTAAFLLPIINKIIENPKERAIIIAPTRELAQQIEKEMRDFAFGLKIFSVCVVGGMPIYRQISQIQRGVSVVIGTPGRIDDLIQRGDLDINQYKYVVLDEADRMLDMGFIDDIRKILKTIKSKDRQSMFFSATMPNEIRKLCDEFLNNPITVSVKTRDTSNLVDQDIVRIRHKSERIEVLHELLVKPEFSKVLIFREMKRQVDELQKELLGRGFKTVTLHGDMRNSQRIRSVKALTNGEAHILIATDVAARGIDIPDITYVINYDVPRDYETYIHRIGRTGRGNSKGNALTFV